MFTFDEIKKALKQMGEFQFWKKIALDQGKTLLKLFVVRFLKKKVLKSLEKSIKEFVYLRRKEGASWDEIDAEWEEMDRSLEEKKTIFSNLFNFRQIFNLG